MNHESDQDRELDPEEFESMDAGLQELLSPLASRPADEAGKLALAERVLEARAERRRNDRSLWLAAACALIGLLLWRSVADSSTVPTLPDANDNVVVQVADLPRSEAFDDGSMIRFDDSTEYEVLRSKGPTEALALESGRLRLDLSEKTRFFVRVGDRRITAREGSALELRWLDGQLDIEIIRGEARVRGPRSRWELVAGARCTSVESVSESGTRLSTPRLPGTTKRLLSLLEKFDRRPVGDGSRFPFRVLANAAETDADTYALWCLFDLAEDEGWVSASQELEGGLLALAGSPTGSGSVKSPAPTVDDWRKHLAPRWR